MVSELGGQQDPAGDGRLGIRRRQVGEAVGRSYGRLVDAVADARAVPCGDDERETRVDRVVVERAAAAGRVGVALQQRQFDLEVAVLGVRFRDVDDLVVAEVQLGQRMRPIRL